MRFDCGLSKEKRIDAKVARLMEWHDHFAWWPIRLGDHDCRWLETLERRAVGQHWRGNEYRGERLVRERLAGYMSLPMLYEYRAKWPT